jgi:HKD family nuclease
MILLTNNDEKLIKTVQACLRECLECKIAVAYIRNSGVNPIISTLEAIKKRGGKIKIVTSDQMGITEKEAILSLLDIGVEIKVYVNANKVFHPKAYIFKGAKNSKYIIGSSNISRSAFFDGVEWNLFFDNSNPVSSSIEKSFDDIWSSTDVNIVSKENIDSHFNSTREQILKHFEEKEDAVVAESEQTLDNILKNNPIYQVSKRQDHNSTWNFNLSVNKVNRLSEKGSFYVIVRCNYESNDEIVFASSSDHLDKHIFPYANQGKSSRYLFEVNKRTFHFNWQRSVKMDGRPFIVS